MSALKPTRSNHSSINAISLLYCRTGSIGVCANAIGRPSASVRISAASGIVRTSPARSISRRFKTAASVNARAPNQPMSSTPVFFMENLLAPFSLQGSTLAWALGPGTKTQDHMRGEAEAAHGFLDAPLVVEVRDARPLVRRSHGCVDVVFDAGLARQCRKTLALRLFPLDARLPRGLHAEDAPRAGQRTAQRRLVIEIALNDVDAVARQRRRPLALRLTRQAAQTEPAALQRLRDRAALIACHSGDENSSAHSFVLVSTWLIS